MRTILSVICFIFPYRCLPDKANPVAPQRIGKIFNTGFLFHHISFYSGFYNYFYNEYNDINA